MVSACDVQRGFAGTDDAGCGDVCCVGALVEDRGFPAIVDIGVDALAVDHDVWVGPVLAATGPVDEGLNDLGTLGYRNRGGSTTQLRHRVNFGPVGIDPDVSVSDTEVADKSATFG